MDKTRYYLELTVADLKTGRMPPHPLSLRQLTPGEGALAAWLYKVVGEGWHWVDRAFWSDGLWTSRLSEGGVEIWIASRDDEPVGYFELQQRAATTWEVIYFGLLPRAIGRGLGSHLLTLAVERTVAQGAATVILNTCSLDHPYALANYKARGFRITRVEHL